MTATSGGSDRTLVEAFRSIKARSFGGTIVALVVLGGLAALVFGSGQTYAATAVVAVAPSNAAPPFGDQEVALLLTRYSAYAGSDWALRSAVRSATANSDDRPFKASLAIPPSSALLRITVSGADRPNVAKVANALADVAIQFVERDGILRAENVAAAQTPSPGSLRSRAFKAALALILAIVAGLAWILVLEARRPRVRSSRRLRAFGFRVVEFPRSRRGWWRRSAAKFALRENAVRELRGAVTSRTGNGEAVESRASGLVVSVVGLARRSGCTTTADSLANSLASLGSSVLLVTIERSGGLKDARPSQDLGPSVSHHPTRDADARIGDAPDINPGDSHRPGAVSNEVVLATPERFDQTVARLPKLLHSRLTQYDAIVIDVGVWNFGDLAERVIHLSSTRILVVGRGAGLSECQLALNQVTCGPAQVLIVANGVG